MATITSDQYQLAYAKAVAAGNERLDSAAEELVRETGMNSTSARDYIRSINHMLRGEVFHRTMRDSAVEYVLTAIYQDFGQEALGRALQSVTLHADYYKKIASDRPSLRRMADAFKNRYLAGPTLQDIEEQFFDEVKSAKRKSRAERIRTIGHAPGPPKFRLVTVRMFIRSADVVAETLSRANGICEACHSSAPFVRFDGNSEYLEVHHIVPLAEGGFDTLANAVALCPNCHREAHFGIERGKYRLLNKSISI